MNPISLIWIRGYFGEDRTVNRMQGKPPIYSSGSWQERIGIEPEKLCRSTAPTDMALPRDDANQVDAAAEAFLQQVDEATLQREMDLPIGRVPAIDRLSFVLVAHKFAHLGEISALLGCQGRKGFPFCTANPSRLLPSVRGVGTTNVQRSSLRVRGPARAAGDMYRSGAPAASNRRPSGCASRRHMQ